eukprot:snap_masked-scaffold_5-processed-gene-2.16-mRNA-1 protein AED:1.00 eAED:1.00 QI:0/-1/0/0/-1/1/1/0/321
MSVVKLKKNDMKGVYYTLKTEKQKTVHARFSHEDHADFYEATDIDKLKRSITGDYNAKTFETTPQVYFQIQMFGTNEVSQKNLIKVVSAALSSVPLGARLSIIFNHCRTGNQLLEPLLQVLAADSWILSFHIINNSKNDCVLEIGDILNVFKGMKSLKSIKFRCARQKSSLGTKFCISKNNIQVLDFGNGEFSSGFSLSLYKTIKLEHLHITNLLFAGVELEENDFVLLLLGLRKNYVLKELEAPVIGAQRVISSLLEEVIALPQVASCYPGRYFRKKWIQRDFTYFVAILKKSGKMKPMNYGYTRIPDTAKHIFERALRI